MDKKARAWMLEASSTCWFSSSVILLALPAFPSGHKQEKEATRSMQVDPGVQEAKAQSSMFSLQSSPLQPFTHTQP